MKRGHYHGGAGDIELEYEFDDMEYGYGPQDFWTGEYRYEGTADVYVTYNIDSSDVWDDLIDYEPFRRDYPGVAEMEGDELIDWWNDHEKKLIRRYYNYLLDCHRDAAYDECLDKWELDESLNRRHRNNKINEDLPLKRDQCLTKEEAKDLIKYCRNNYVKGLCDIDFTYSNNVSMEFDGDIDDPQLCAIKFKNWLKDHYHDVVVEYYDYGDSAALEIPTTTTKYFVDRFGQKYVLGESLGKRYITWDEARAVMSFSNDNKNLCGVVKSYIKEGNLYIEYYGDRFKFTKDPLTATEDITFKNLKRYRCQDVIFDVDFIDNYRKDTVAIIPIDYGRNYVKKDNREPAFV